MQHGGEVVRVEVEPIREAMADLVRAHRRLCQRRGPVYRRLQRDIEDRAGEIMDLDVVIHDIGEGVYVMAPPDQVVALLRRARALSLL